MKETHGVVTKAWVGSGVWILTTKRQEGHFGGDGNIVYLDCDIGCA